jgi:hypothetical protein
MLKAAGASHQAGGFLDARYLWNFARFTNAAHLPGQFTAI